MGTDDLVPIIVGIGDVKNGSLKIEAAVEPMQLMLQAIHGALGDTALPHHKETSLKASIDSIDVVATWTWPYADLPGLICQKLGVLPRHRCYSKHGGNQPIKAVDEVARRISQGLSSVAVVTGGEALASLSACTAAKQIPPPGWTTPERSSKIGSPLELATSSSSIGVTHSVGLPIHVYPLYENAFRAHRGQSMNQNQVESGRLYSEFAKIAEQNPFSWTYGKSAPTEDVICTPSPSNRMICFPYTLLMNAFNKVNLAAACILTSTKHAREIGISEEKWIYPLGGAGTQDADSFWERPDFYSSAAISRSLDECLKVSGLTKEQIHVFDFYSCFPIVPKLACHHLGLPLSESSKPLTILGGLTFFGGAGNNYSLHSLTAMVRVLRGGKHHTGLILANGGVLSYQHAISLSTQPRDDASSYPITNPLPKYVTDVPVPPIVAQANGKAIVETYTVEFDRQGAPVKGFIIARSLDGRKERFVANAGSTRTLEQLASQVKEPIGRVGWVQTDGNGRNLFHFDNSANL